MYIKINMKIKLIIITAITLISYSVPVCVYANYIETPDGAIEFNGHTYKFYTESTDWRSAKNKCNEYGGHLVTITSEEENSFLIENLPQSDKSFYWIGATDEVEENVWQWVTNEAFSYNNWSEDSPNNDSNSEHYAGFMSKEKNYDGYPTPIGSWNDFQVSSTDNSGYICEWDFVKNADNTENDNNQYVKENSDSSQTKSDNLEPNESGAETKGGINVTFHIDNLSLIGGLSIFGGISFIGLVLKKNKRN